MSAKGAKGGNMAAKIAGRAGKDRFPRTTFMCVWGCGRSIQVGGAALLGHLVYCQGRKRGSRGQARRDSAGA